MSFKTKHPGVYRCDAGGCPAKVDGDLFDQPEGWTTRELKVYARPSGELIDTITQHFCPAHTEANK